MDDKIYTHNEAAEIVELFKEILDRYGIRVPAPEDDEREEVYSELLESVEDKLLCIIERVKAGDKVVEYEFE